MKYDKAKSIRETLQRLIFNSTENNKYLDDLEYLLREKTNNEELYVFVMCFLRFHKNEIFQFIGKSDEVFEKFKRLIFGYVDKNPRYKKLTDDFQKDFELLNQSRKPRLREVVTTEKIEIKMNENLFYIKGASSNIQSKPAEVKKIKQTAEKQNYEQSNNELVKELENFSQGINLQEELKDNQVINVLNSFISIGSIIVEDVDVEIPKKPVIKQPIEINKIFQPKNPLVQKAQEVGKYIMNNQDDFKSREENQRNIDSLIPADGDLYNYYKENLTNNDLYGKFGFFTEGKSISNLDPEYRLKFISFYLKFFPLFTYDQKVQIVRKIEHNIFIHSFFDTDFKIRIRTSIMNYRDKQRLGFPKDIISNIIKNTIKGAEYFKYEDYMKCNSEEDVRELYLVHILNKVYKVIPDIDVAKIAFYLYIMLMKNPIFLSDDSLLYDLYIVKTFYSDMKFTLFERSNKNQITYKGINFSKIQKLIFNELFTEDENKLAQQVLNSVQKFYRVDSAYLDLINENNIRFTLDIVELIYYKNKAKGKIIPNLLKLEEQLYKNYLQLNKGFTSNFDHLSFINLYKGQYRAYRYINDYCQKVARKISASVRLYPYGSISQFLGSKTSDLDLYIEISNLNNEISNMQSVSFFKAFKDNMGKIPEVKDISDILITARLVTLSFSFGGYKIDLNYYGIPGVLNSALLRCYSVCDPRFIILAYNLKDMLKQKQLNNTSDKKVYLNSFSWMMILVTFLQDVISPPVLPKLLKESDFIDFKLEKNKRKTKSYGYKTRYDIHDLYETDLDYYTLSDTFFNRYIEIYNKQIIVKNEMSCAELYTKFIEYIGFFFKQDSVYIDCKAERFLSKSENKKFNSNGKFNFEYFNEKQKKCLILRDPFDHTYNPAGISDDKKAKLFSELRYFYYQLIGAVN
jgi:hypothetical protein